MFIRDRINPRRYGPFNTRRRPAAPSLVQTFHWTVSDIALFVRFLRSSELILVPLLGNVAIPTSWTATIPRSMRNMRGKIGWGTMSTRHSEPRLSLRMSVGRGSVLVIGNEVMETQENQKFCSAESQSGAVLKARKAHRACRIRAVCDCRGPSPKLSRRTPVLIFEPRVD